MDSPNSFSIRPTTQNVNTSIPTNPFQSVTPQNPFAISQTQDINNNNAPSSLTNSTFEAFDPIQLVGSEISASE
jgi:hypothetical protein